MRQLRVDAALLPDSFADRDAILRQYFAQLSVGVHVEARECVLTLSRPIEPEFYIDPQLEAGLAWWTDCYGTVTVKDVPFACSDKNGFQLSLDDAWTLHSWSRWWSRNALVEASRPVTVLHVDDHTDLMTPRILIEESAWRDAITRKAVCLTEPASIAAAIRSGAIGIGSFIPPFLHAVPRIDVRHLCASGEASVSSAPRRLATSRVPDTLLAPGKFRPASVLDSVAPGPGDHSYLITDDLACWLDRLSVGPVLLHLDMDYFNNRYDGDSDWAEKPTRHDPPLHAVLSRIDEVFDALRHSGAMSKIADVTVALSPGFFPAEYWPASIERIEQHMSAYGN